MSNECTLTDRELISKIDSINGALCKSGGKSWRLSVPPDVDNDPDLLIAEMTKRFERLVSGGGVKVWVSWDEGKFESPTVTTKQPHLNKDKIGRIFYTDLGQNITISKEDAAKLNLNQGECKAFEIREVVSE